MLYRASDFSLAPLENLWWGTPHNSELLFRSRFTELKIGGSILTAQFEAQYGYLLLTEYEPPLDQTLHIYLIDSSFRVLERRRLSYSLKNGRVENLQIVDERLRFSFISEAIWEIVPLDEPRFQVYCRESAEEQMFQQNYGGRWFARRYLELRKQSG
jgi:hypothetical protein